MKKSLLPFIATLVAGVLSSHSAYGNSDITNSHVSQSCLIDVPTFNRPLAKGNVNSLPILTEASRFEAIYPNTAIYQGDVEITQGNRTVNADKATIETQKNKDRLVKLEGNLIYFDNSIKMNGSYATMNLNTNNIDIGKSEYHFVDRLGHGSADNLKYENGRYIILKNGNYTSCPINSHSWGIEGTTIIHDNEEQLLEVWNAVFRIGNIPVLYSPYMQLPTGSKRRSGLLMPTFSYNDEDGVNVSLPIYWNMAPNYDLTLTPKVIQKRGVQVQNEFRYLNLLGQGTIAFDWLTYDALYAQERANATSSSNYGNSDERWLFYWNNGGLINENWRFNADLTKVSDSQYLNEISSSFASETDGYLTQYYQIAYANQNWDIGLSYRHFQLFRSETIDKLYQTEPQLDINYYNYDLGPFKFKTFAQVTHFVGAAGSSVDTWRTHIEPTIDYTLSNAWSMITSEVGMMATHYQQENSVNRYVPKFSVDGKLLFERNTTLLDGYTQTLEPRVKYLYIPYHDQTDIPNYDSTLLQSDYVGLFRDAVYSGLDKISSANKIAAGITNRFYDKYNTERFNLSLGEITYFAQSRTGEQNTELDKNSDSSSITWAADSYWQASDNLFFRGGIQYDTRLGEVSLASASFEYKPTRDKIAQLSYRYATKKYIDSIGALSDTPYKQDISQAGIILAWPVIDTIRVVGSYYYDVKLTQTVDSSIGLNYSDCCWGVTIRYGRKLTDWDQTTKQSQYENKFSINFELNVFDRYNNATAKMLDYGKLQYVTTFEEKTSLEKKNSTD